MGGCASRPKELDATSDAPVEAPTAEVENVAPETKNEGEKDAPLLDPSEPKSAEVASEAKPEPAPAGEEPAKEAKEEKATSNEPEEEKAKAKEAPSTEVKTEAPLVTV